MSMAPFYNDTATAVFQWFGIVVFSFQAIKYSIKMVNNVITFAFGCGSVNFKKHGNWAVVTGCTDGIGKAYAELLGKQGLNVVLISRTLVKLEKQAEELMDKYPISTKIIAVDFTEPDTIYEKINQELAGLDIGLLVNNVGMAQSTPEYFHLLNEANGDRINSFINCNITSTTKMTAIVLPGMLERKRGGVIINVSSAAGRMVTPLMTIYSATKAFVDFFSRGLNTEYKSKGITVQSLCPYYVSTKMSGVGISLVAPSAFSYAKSALKTISTQSISNGCLIHNIEGWASEEIIPEWLYNKIVLVELSATRDRIKAAKDKDNAENAKGQ